MDPSPPTGRTKVGGVLAALRRKRELTQSGLARELEVTQAYVSKLESGLANYENMPVSTVNKLAASLRFELDDWNEILQGEMPGSRSYSPGEIPTLSSHALSAGSRYGNIRRRREIEIPDALKEAAELYGHLPMYAGIREHRWQHFMVTASRKAMPQDAEGWLREFSDLKRMDYDPEEPE